MYAGMDTRDGGGENWNGTYTGYYLKKFINPAEGDHRNKINAVFPFIRLTEVDYTYIEACIELNDLTEAKKYLNDIRKNLNLPEVTTNDQDELRRIFQNDKRLDFYFEEHRYWDLRRWMIAPDAPGLNSLNGIRVTGRLKAGIPKQEKPTYDEDRWSYTYTVVPLLQENRKWVDKCYYLPIHRNEMQRNKNLIQNPGYSD